MKRMSRELTMTKLWLRRSALALTLLSVCGASCAQTSQSGSTESTPARVGDVHGSSGPDAPGLQERYPRYQVMPSDILAISFPLIPELQTVPVTVEPDGFITLPNGEGTLYVKGLTLPQIVDAL